MGKSGRVLNHLSAGEKVTKLGFTLICIIYNSWYSNYYRTESRSLATIIPFLSIINFTISITTFIVSRFKFFAARVIKKTAWFLTIELLELRVCQGSLIISSIEFNVFII